MSTTYTTNYHLGKQEDTSDNFNMSVITDNMDTIDSVLGNKSDKSTTYTKAEVDTALGGKQNTISDLSTIRSGAALGATAVQPETGKGLSTNDYTTAEKTKLAGIAEGAEVNEIEGIKVNSTTVNPDVNKVVNITVPTTAADVSALPDTTKYAAALSLTINSSTFVMTGQLKDQNGDNLGTAQTIDLPLESVVVGGSYNSQTKIVVLTLQNGNTIEFSVADLVSGLQTELSASNKLNPAYINYDSTHRAVSDTEKSTWNSKQNALSSTQLDAVNSGIDSTKVEQIETNKNNILSINAATAFARKRTTVSASSRTISYTMSKDDFRADSNDSGVYLITVVPWGATALVTMYTIAYSGGNLSYRTATKICGSDITFTFSGGTFEFNTSGLVTIYAMQ